MKTAKASSKNSPKRKIGGLPILIDGEPIRRAARQAHEKARTQMELVEKQIDRFERLELPAYQRWLFLTFGPMLTELRELESALIKKEYILGRVQEYQMWDNMSPVHAYAKVKSEMENPDWGTQTETETADSDEPTDEEEDQLRSIYEFASQEFEEETGYEAPDFESFKQAIGLESGKPGNDGDKAGHEKSRVKSLYRKIARALHPDCSETFSLREQKLWTRAQAAYKNGDIVGLETVLSHIEAAASGPLFASCVSDLIENTKGMQMRIEYLQDDLREAREHPAWRFTQKTPTQLVTLQKRVEKSIRQSVEQARNDLTSTEKDLQELELAHARMVARKNKSRKKREAALSSQQASFDF